MRDHAGEMRNEGIAFQHRELCPRLSLVFRQPLVFGERRCEVTRPLPDQCAKPHLIHHEDEDEKRDTGEDPAVLDEDVLECQGFRREGAHPERLIEIAHGVQLPCDLPGERPLIRHREEGDRHGFDEFRAREIQRPENVIWVKRRCVAALKETIRVRGDDAEHSRFDQPRFFRGLKLTRGEDPGVRFPIHHVFHHVRILKRPVTHAAEKGVWVVA